jgi:hypothetical protein
MAGRFDYIKYDEHAQLEQAKLKTLFLALEEKVEELQAGRPKALALTAIEEAYMWVGKAIRDEQINRDSVEK